MIALLKVRLLALHTNNRLGWKGLPGTNTLASYEILLITAVKFFITLAPDDIQDRLLDEKKGVLDT
jgi:hypothetical protein